MIYLTSDHGGFELKTRIREFLEKREEQYVDLGPFKYEPGDDYPLYAEKISQAVVENHGKGIAICKSGVGMAIAVNKTDGIRAVEGYSVEETKLSREHNDTNILVLGANDFDPVKGWEIIKTWLETKFSGDERHIRRIGEIEEYEQEN
jgi:ribose 5-phosphate isomerase B